MVQRGDLELAFDMASHAIDATARMEYQAERIGQSERYKRFLNENLWVITSGTVIAHGGHLQFPNVFRTVRGVGDPSAQPFITLEDVLYHAVRCSLTHESELPRELTFHQDDGSLAILPVNGGMSLSSGWVYGLVASVVAAPCNAGHTGGPDLHIDFKSKVSVTLPQLWGQREKIREILFPETTQATEQSQSEQALADPKTRPGRNDPCPCGSGRKYKRCCGKADGT